MLIEATSQPIRFHLLDGNQVRLDPGKPVDLPEKQARALLAKAGGKVRVIGSDLNAPDAVTVEPAACRRPVFWETASGQILGPATVSHVARVLEGNKRQSFWLCIEFQSGWRWIHENRLRTPQAADRQQRQ